MTGDARSVVLSRVRAALGPAPAAPLAVPRAYRQAGRTAHPDVLVERFCERVAEYRARVHRATEASLQAVVADLVAGRRVVVPAAAPCAVHGCEAIGDDPIRR